ncbi:phosphonate ABC transporter ATP-binding protein [Rhodococcus spongiicola]|uniref:Phosphonate ABC transporter ATP-binding protein n=1 Tax=Rhodococcus spongiicola TaxID=2487352 RepID=A0A3S3AE22_9NOCA|nr:phosphonate ABC transporter ATP-binding protein [Rhodococcus spongiicola]RVW02399.1 phosphonate ABC transporter ATP-binding protein [Rhodococcus spongiicola]
MTGAGEAVSFRDVHLTYTQKDEAVLRGVNLEIPASDFCILLGRSGTGKSTLLRCINGLVAPYQGTVSVGGEEVHTTHRNALRNIRRKVGMIFQGYNLVNRLTVMHNVLAGILPDVPAYRAIPGIFTTGEREQALSLLDTVGLANYANHRADQLSGGQKQRVGIARALAQNPKVILADEPIASLDPVTAAEILDLLKRINERDGITVVLSLHQLNFARTYGERIVALLDGRIGIDTTPAGLSEGEVDRIYGRGVEKAA